MKRLTGMLRNLNKWWQDRDPETRLLAHYLRQAVINFSRYGLRWAAALAYYTIFSIFPLSLLIAIGVSRVMGTNVAQEQIANALVLFLPDSEEAVSLILESIQQALDQDTSFGTIALIGLVWSGLGLFTNLASSLDAIFHVPEGRSLWQQRVVALVMVLILVLLVTASFLTSGIISLISIIFFHRPGIWLTMASLFLPFSLNMMVFVLLFRFVPSRMVYWDAIWPAAIVGASGFELAKRAFSWYLTNFANYQVVFGSIATVIVLLFWAYLLAAVFLFSAELCAQLNEWFLARDQDEGYYRLESPASRRLPD